MGYYSILNRGNSETCSMDELWWDYAEWNKPVAKDKCSGLYDSTFIYARHLEQPDFWRQKEGRRVVASDWGQEEWGVV